VHGVEERDDRRDDKGAKLGSPIGPHSACYSTLVERASDYDFVLPDAQIAHAPLAERDGARLLVVGKDGLSHRAIVDLPALLPEGALLVVNDTRVLPARLYAEKPTSGRVELLLCELISREGRDERWRAMAGSSKPMRTGPLRLHGERAPAVEVVAVAPPYVELVLRPQGDEPLMHALERVGQMPLPPYIMKARATRGVPEVDDRERYQTVFAERVGAIAAPTAGLHLSEPLLARLAARGIERAAITLHVGPGTFAPLRSDVLTENELHAERYAISEQVAAQVNDAHAAGRPIVAVGTTVVRALEASASTDGAVHAGEGETRLFIRPRYRFRVVDHMLTNFHLPRSSLLVLVATFAGKERVLAGYREAVDAGYRFYSYGDATLLSRAEAP
jgi:S-adenosylmethionine:tRNA ribosyltransferase-isomerase